MSGQPSDATLRRGRVLQERTRRPRRHSDVRVRRVDPATIPPGTTIDLSSPDELREREA
jgi:hypothetical protein